MQNSFDFTTYLVLFIVGIVASGIAVILFALVRGTGMYGRGLMSVLAAGAVVASYFIGWRGMLSAALILVAAGVSITLCATTGGAVLATAVFGGISGVLLSATVRAQL